MDIQNFLKKLRSFNLAGFFRKNKKMNLIEFARVLRHWMKNNLRTIAIAAGVFFVLVIGLVFYFSDRASKNAEAEAHFSQALNIYFQGMRADSLTMEEQKEALTAALQRFQYVLSRFPGSSIYDEALFYVGNVLYTTGNFQEAEARFKEYLKKYPRKYLAPFACENAGYCWEQQDNSEKAREYYMMLKDKYSDSSLAGRAGIDLGRLFEQENRMQEAIEAYRDVSTYASGTKWEQSAQMRIAYLEARLGPVQPQQTEMPALSSP